MVGITTIFLSSVRSRAWLAARTMFLLFGRMKIVLACYNGGIGHVTDARNLARKYGANPDSWNDVSEYLTLKSDPQYARDEVVRNGRFVGRQTLAFVRDVISRYSVYCRNVSR